MKKILPFIVLCSTISCHYDEKVELSIPPTLDEPVKKEEVITSSSLNHCPSEMVYIAGNYCTKVDQKCIKWLENPSVTPRARCAEFAPSVCIGERNLMSFCIDREEYTENLKGLPVSDVSWTEAKDLCEKQGKRLCSEEEWTFACEGEDMLPYTTGYVRPSKLCNIDIEKNVICGKDLCDYRRDISEFTECKSPFGVHNMAGNVDEWVSVPKYAHSKIPNLWMRSGLKGGHWLPIRARCRPITKDHEEKYFHQISIGFRCCK